MSNVSESINAIVRVFMSVPPFCVQEGGVLFLKFSYVKKFDTDYQDLLSCGRWVECDALCGGLSVVVAEVGVELCGDGCAEREVVVRACERGFAVREADVAVVDGGAVAEDVLVVAYGDAVYFDIVEIGVL